MLTFDQHGIELEIRVFSKLIDLLRSSKVKLGVGPDLKIIFGVCMKYIPNFMLLS